MKQLAVIGAGAWGTTLASIFRDKFTKCTIWTFLAEEEKMINELKENKLYLPGMPLDIRATTSLPDAVKDADIIISAVPSFAIRKTWMQLSKIIKSGSVFINASKGIEKDKHLLPYEIFQELFEDKIHYMALCGPSFAVDVAKGSPTAVNLAGNDRDFTQKVISKLNTDTFFMRYSDDIIGTELGAVLKNVIAIASGMVIGMGYGQNTQAIVVVEGIKEMMILGELMGGKSETFLGLAGLGDLLLTAMNAESRNMTFGYELGKGMQINDALKDVKGVAEGYYTTFSLDFLLQKHKLKLPLFSTMVDTLVNKHSFKDTFSQLLTELF